MTYRILIFGAGAIGTYVGVQLMLQGHQVVFLERQNDLEDLSRRGLKLEVGGKVTHIPHPDLIGDLDKIKSHSFDLAVIALKTYHLDDVLPQLIPIQEHLPPILSLQNGVLSEEILRAQLGKIEVIAGTVTTAVDRYLKGDVIIQRSRGIGLAGTHQLVPGLMRAFQMAGLEPQHYSSEKDLKWSKLILNLLGNASSAILNMTPAEVYSDPGLFRLEQRQVLETIKVMHRQGIRIVDLPGIPVRLLAAVFQYLPASLSKPLLSRLIGGGRGGKMPSFYVDLHSGKGKSEVSHLNGAVVEAGRRSQIPTPVNQLLSSVLSDMTSGEVSIQKYDHNSQLLLDQLSP